MKLVLFCAASAAALSPNGKLPVMKIVVEGSPPFDAVAHFEGLAAGSDGAVAAGAGEDGAGPGARVLIDGDAALFGAGDMGEDERRRKAFDLRTADDADRAWGAATRLRERLGGLAAAAPAAPAVPGGEAAAPATSAGFYGEDELRSLLAMHETLKDDAGLDEAAEAGVPGGFDLHDIVRSMVEEDGDDA